MTAHALIAEMLTTEWVKCARGPDQYDCWGMVCAGCERMGWPKPRDPIPDWSGAAELRGVFGEELKPGEWVKSAAVDGAVAFWPDFARARHAGLVIAGGILHTSQARGPEWVSLSSMTQEPEFMRWVS